MVAEQELDVGLPEADLVLEAWYRTEHFAAADLSAQVEHAALAQGAAGTAAIAVHVEVFDHDDVWTITLVFAQDARAVLVGVPSEPLEMGPLQALLGTSPVRALRRRHRPRPRLTPEHRRWGCAHREFWRPSNPLGHWVHENWREGQPPGLLVPLKFMA